MTKLWIVKRTDQVWYDEYDSMVVAADTEEEARFTHPADYVESRFRGNSWGGWFWKGTENSYSNSTWVSPNLLTVEYLGTTDRDIKGVVLASFNAG